MLLLLALIWSWSAFANEPTLGPHPAALPEVAVAEAMQVRRFLAPSGPRNDLDALQSCVDGGDTIEGLGLAITAVEAVPGRPLRLWDRDVALLDALGHLSSAQQRGAPIPDLYDVLVASADRAKNLAAQGCAPWGQDRPEFEGHILLALDARLPAATVQSILQTVGQAGFTQPYVQVEAKRTIVPQPASPASPQVPGQVVVSVSSDGYTLGLESGNALRETGYDCRGDCSWATWPTKAVAADLPAPLRESTTDVARMELGTELYVQDIAIAASTLRYSTPSSPRLELYFSSVGSEPIDPPPRRKPATTTWGLDASVPVVPLGPSPAAAVLQRTTGGMMPAAKDETAPAPAVASGVGGIGGSPGITLGEPLVLGAWESGQIVPIVTASASALLECYHRAVSDTPGLAGKVVIKFVIAKDGSISSAVVRQSALERPDAERCMTDRILTLKFPPVPGGGIVIVSYPLVFSPGSVD